MKDLRFAIIGALAITGVLGAMFLFMFLRKDRDPSFTFPGPGYLDFSAHLAGDYYVYRTSGSDIKIAPDAWNAGTPIIPNTVVECGTDGRFIIAKRRDIFEDEDPKHQDFWILDTKEPSVEGPLTEAEFISRRRSLQIPESVVLRNVYDFRSSPPATSSGTKTSPSVPYLSEDLELEEASSNIEPHGHPLK